MPQPSAPEPFVALAGDGERSAIAAERDRLTDLWSRPATEARLDHALAHDPIHLVMLVVDLDGLPTVNTTYGWAAGDLVLQEVADRLAGCVRSTDIVGRIGGDQFAVIMVGAGTGVEHGLHDRIEVALADPIFWDDGFWRPAATIGMARGWIGDSASTITERAWREVTDIRRRGRGPH